jgi:hypothetical protein
LLEIQRCLPIDLSPQKAVELIPAREWNKTSVNIDRLAAGVQWLNEFVTIRRSKNKTIDEQQRGAEEDRRE